MRSQGNHRDGTSVVITAAVRLHGLRLQQLLLFTVETSVSKAARDISCLGLLLRTSITQRFEHLHLAGDTHLAKEKNGKKIYVISQGGSSEEQPGVKYCS